MPRRELETYWVLINDNVLLRSLDLTLRQTFLPGKDFGHHNNQRSRCSVAKLCLTRCNPMDCSTPGFPVLPYLLEFAQTHVHWVYNTIQPSHPLSPSSPHALNLSHHQGLFQWINSSHQVAKVLELQLQHQSFQWIYGLISFRIDWFDLLAVQETLKSLLQHHNLKTSFFGAQLSLWSNSHICTWLLEKP